MISCLVSLVYIRMQMRLSLTKVTGHTYSLVLAPPCFFVVVFFPLPQTRERYSRRRQTQGWICCFISGLESLLFGRKSLAQLAPPLNFGWKIRMSVCNLQVNLAASRSSGAFIIRSHRSRIFLQGVFFFFFNSCFFFFELFCLTGKSMKTLLARLLRFVHTLAFFSARCKWKFI